MKRTLLILSLPFLALGNASAFEREYIWPEGMMPDCQDHQIAAMTDESNAAGFDRSKHTAPYLEWFDAPAPEKRNGGCAILISGGGYYNCCDVNLIKEWRKRMTELGFQCVNFVYRTPRPKGLPVYVTAWEDGQRAVRMVRSEAERRGFDPDNIGTLSMSAGSHLALLLATSSLTPAYQKIDALDDIPCNTNWAIVFAPAYATTDGENGTPAIREGYGADVDLSPVFKFDEKTCPMSLHHGGMDPYSPNGSTQVYRRLRRMGIPAELHLYPGRPHGAYGLERGVEFLTQMGICGEVQPEVDLMERFTANEELAVRAKEDVWPEGKTPDFREDQCKPYLEWFIPKNLKTRAIQIIYSGGAYNNNKPDGFEVVPARKYLNSLGMAVVAVRYRTPRPKGLAKHTTAWEDIQRVVRIVRSEAASYGLDPNRIGIMGSSAGGHLTLMGVTSSRHKSYLPIDDIDKLPCNVQWGIGIYPAYVLSDGINGPNKEKGNTEGLTIAPEFSFDLSTAPMLLLHGDDDVYSSMGSVMVWEKMRAMGIQSELHTLCKRGHCFQKTASPGTGSYTWLERISDFLSSQGIL